jgi:hypothetical protein
MFELNEKSKIIKNLLAFNVAFVLLFASINSSASIQPILNQDGNLGISSQMIVYGVQVLTSLVFPQIVCDFIGYKFAMVLSEVFQLTYICMQIYPTWATLTPSILNLFLFFFTVSDFV